MDEARSLLRAAMMLEAIEATLQELREMDDPRNDELIAGVERQRETLLRELDRLAVPVQ